MLWRRLLLGGLALSLFAIFCAWLWLTLKQPSVQTRAEIYQGVYLTVEDGPETPEGHGKVMIVEVHWDTPGIRIANRPFDYPVNAADATSPHYKLEFADFALRRTGAAVLMNSNLFFPYSVTSALTGRPVRAVETVIVEGEVSHVHEHSYLLYWDAVMNAHMVQTKPPDPESLAAAKIGLGMQGVQVRDGKPVPAALGNKDEVDARTFIGIDPDARVLYLMAFEKASGHAVIERAVAAGVVFGGQLDSGSATNLLIGRGAHGIGAHTGIRNARPIGPFLTIYADPL